jgi:hypothetical protein
MSKYIGQIVFSIETIDTFLPKQIYNIGSNKINENIYIK